MRPQPLGHVRSMKVGFLHGVSQSGAVLGQGLSAAQSSRDMAATVPEKADICPRTMPLRGPLHRTPRMGYLHPPRLVGGAVHGASCNMHAVALINSMALGDDPIPLE